MWKKLERFGDRLLQRVLPAGNAAAQQECWIASSKCIMETGCATGYNTRQCRQCRDGRYYCFWAGCC